MSSNPGLKPSSPQPSKEPRSPRNGAKMLQAAPVGMHRADWLSIACGPTAASPDRTIALQAAVHHAGSLIHLIVRNKLNCSIEPD
jgi:hypothetical protein